MQPVPVNPQHWPALARDVGPGTRQDPICHPYRRFLC